MAEEYDKPIPTKITENVLASLMQVRAGAGGYRVTLEPERINKDNHQSNNPRHGLAVICPDDPQQTGSNTDKDDYTRTYLIQVYLIPSQLDGVPIDEWNDMAVADVRRALCDPTTNNHTRGGLAIDTTPRDPVTVPLPKSAGFIVNCLFDVVFETACRNLYRKD